MVKMRCLRAHSSMVWGSPVDGEIFDVHEGYVEQLVGAGLAERVEFVEDKAESQQSEGAVDSLIANDPPTTRRGRSKW